MITPEDEEKIASYWIATEREWYRQGLRKALPCDVQAGRGDASYLISSFVDVYRYILKHAGCTYEDLKSELDLSAPVIVNNIAVLKARDRFQQSDRIPADDEILHQETSKRRGADEWTKRITINGLRPFSRRST